MDRQYMTSQQVESLRDAIDPAAWIKDVDIQYASRHFWRRAQSFTQKDRFGEVAFAVERPNGRFITITCREYPADTYRIPTGGISHGEDVLQAVHREVLEELGLAVCVVRLIGVLRIRFTHQTESFPFYSFLFHLREQGGRLLEDAMEDEVSAVREEDAAGLLRTAEALLSIRQEWRDWGRFRHATTMEIARYANTLTHADIGETLV